MTTTPLAARIAERLARPIPPQDDTPIGSLSHARARYLMGAAAVAGGAVYVGVAPFLDMFVGDGRLPNGDPVAERLVPRETAIRKLRREVDRAGRLALRDGPGGYFEEMAEEMLRVLDDVEARGAIVTEPSA